MIQVLLIEDNDDDIELALRAFEKAGWADRVRVARDGQDGLDFLWGRATYAAQGAAATVQLVLLDLNIPKIPGLDVLRQIRAHEQTAKLPVVVFTVSRKEPDLLQSFTMGASDYLIKPINPERLAQICGKFVQGPAK